MTPDAAYRLLLGRFGPQGWWPITPKGRFVPAYRRGRRGPGDERGAFEICVGAILTQNTAWTNVVRALERLSRAGLLTPEGILSRKPAVLGSLIRSSGYFRQKALKLRAFARYVESAGGSVRRRLRGGDLRERREELLGLFGVGPETADSMLLYAGGRRIFVVDAYTRRIGSRLGWFRKDAPYDDIRLFFERGVPESSELYQEFHALFVELGKRACRPKPVCAECPLESRCPKAGIG